MSILRTVLEGKLQECDKKGSSKDNNSPELKDMENIQLQTEPFEEFIIPEIHFNKHLIKVEPEEEQLEQVNDQRKAIEGTQGTTQPFEELFISEFRIEEHSIKLEPEEEEEEETDCLPEKQKTLNRVSTISRNHTKNKSIILKKWKCNECDSSYSDREILAWHIEHCHGTNPVINVLKLGDKEHYQCTFCKIEYRKLPWIIYHLCSKHQLAKLPFHCKFCDKQFVKKIKHREHQLACKTLPQCDVSPVQDEHMEYDDMQTEEDMLISEIDDEEQPIKTESAEESQQECLPEHQSRDEIVSRNHPENEDNISSNLTCDECKITYVNPEMLAWHIENCHGANATVRLIKFGHKKYKFQCVYCKNTYKTSELIIQHLYNEHNLENLPFRCNLCNKQFIRGFNLNRHQVKWHDNKTGSVDLKCNQCDIKFTYPQMLTWHIENCHGSNAIVNVIEFADKKYKFQCVYCKTIGTNSEMIIHHLYNHHQIVNLPFNCNICKKQFIEWHHLKKHQCKRRKIVNKGAAQMKNIEQASEEIVTSDIAIDEHPIKFEPDETQFEHQSRDVELPLENKRPECHAIVRKLLECESCSFYTNNKTELENHMRSHLAPNTSTCSKSKNPRENWKIFTFKCCECGLLYSHPEMLAWHTEYCHGPNAIITVMKSRGKNITFECVQCEEKYRNLDLMIRHLHTEHQFENLPFHCNVCSKQFISRRELLKHQISCKNKNILNKKKKDRNSCILQCDECFISYYGPEMLAWHTEHCHGPNALVKVLKVTNKQYSFQCIQCETNCSGLRPMIHHLYSKHKLVKLPFQCNDCNAQFTARQILDRHQLLCKKKKTVNSNVQ